MAPTQTVVWLAVLLAGLQGVSAPAQSTGDGSLNDETISLLDVAPTVYYAFKRVPKFYGDPNMDRDTIDGSILDRQYLLGSLGGARDAAAEAGLVFDGGVTQVLQGTAAGDGDGARYYGSADLWGVLDTGRAGLWSGGLVIGHIEGNWGQAVAGTGAILPLNADAIMPAAPSSFALSELYLVQSLPAGFTLLAGKADFAGIADKSFFANDERNSFLYEGLVNNPILGSFVTYTTFGAALGNQITDELSLTFVAASNNNDAVTVGFDDIDFDAFTYAVTGTWTPTFGGLPGSYNFITGYTTKDPLNFAVDPRYLLDEIVGAVPVARKDSNYAFLLGGTQYLWVDESATRSDGQPVGVGVFARAGWVPSDRNASDQFYSFGLGGTGGPFGRADDNWGIGWAGSHISSDLRRDARKLGYQLDSFEHVVEGYYNLALTPAVHTSFHIQYVDSANPTRDKAVVLAARLQQDF